MRLEGLLPWLGAGLLVRLTLAPFTSHPYDMTVWISHQLRLFGGGLNPLVDWKFSMPMMGLLVSTFPPAIASSGLLDIPQVIAQQLWIKLPFLLVDLGIAVLLGRLVLDMTGSRRDARLAVLLWLFNPVAIFYTAVHGQFDALPAFLLLLGLRLHQRGKPDGSLAALLLSGTAKYFTFLLIPLLWIWGDANSSGGRARAIRLSLTTVAVFSVAFAGVLVPGVRSSVLGGVASNLAGERPSLWSLWGGIPGTSGIGASWLFAFAAAYGWVLFRMARIRAKCEADTLTLIGGATAILAWLVAFNPFGNPQFVLWVMPLLLLLAFGRRSPSLLVLAAVVGLVGLLAFWASEDANVWVLNAIPGVDLTVDYLRLPPGFADLGVAQALGLTYAVALTIAGVVALPREGGTEMGRDQAGRSWLLAQSATIVAGVACTVAIIAFVLQPRFLDLYGDAPDFPENLVALNTYEASSVSWSPTEDEVVVASWSRPQHDVLAHAWQRAAFLVVGTRLPPAVDHQAARSAIAITRSGIGELFSLDAPSRHVSIRVLLGNDAYGRDGMPQAPLFRVSTGSALKHPIALKTNVEPTSSPGWFFFRLDQTDEVRGRRYFVEIRDPRESGWLWNGTGDRPQRQVPAAAGQRWMQVWAIPDSAAHPRSNTAVEIRADGRVQVVLHLDRPPSTGSEMIALPPVMAAGAPPRVYLTVDLAADPWWRESRLRLAAAWLLAIGYVTAFTVGVWCLAKWGWTGSFNVRRKS